MTYKWTLFILIQCWSMIITHQSIAGVTYMDHFDFEERYRDVNECNPLHWYPLHLPSYCMKMYDEVIRSKLAAPYPLRIKTKNRRTKIPKESVYTLDGYYPEEQFYEVTNLDLGGPLTPYDRMLDLIQRDVMKDPSAPSVQFVPGLGPVALYRQTVSGKTEDLITQVAAAYGKAGQESYIDLAPYFHYPTENSQGENEKNKTKVAKIKKKGKVVKETINYDDGVITILNSKN